MDLTTESEDNSDSNSIIWEDGKSKQTYQGQ